MNRDKTRESERQKRARRHHQVDPEVGELIGRNRRMADENGKIHDAASIIEHRVEIHMSSHVDST